MWLYNGEDSWRSDTWAATLANMVRHARELGVIGLIVDPESMAHDRAAMLALGGALADLKDDFRIGVTSIPTAANLDALVARLGSEVWGSPQIYGRTSQDPADFRRWWERWVSIFGPRCVPSIAGWHAGPLQVHAAAYAAYLSVLPHACGAIVWYEGNELPPFMLAALASFEPGGSLPGTYALAAQAYAVRPAGAVVLGAIALLVALVVAGARVVL